MKHETNLNLMPMQSGVEGRVPRVKQPSHGYFKVSSTRQTFEQFHIFWAIFAQHLYFFVIRAGYFIFMVNWLVYLIA